MNEVQDAIDVTISENESLHKLLKKKSDNRVRTVDERSIIKATSMAWFNNHRPHLARFFGDEALSEIDELYRQILSSSHQAAVRSNYIAKLKTIKYQLLELHSQNLVKWASSIIPRHTSDQPPNFVPLISDPTMQEILRRRWEECTICINAGAPLAATVMMGSLLEALLLARINREPDKAPVFKTSSTPKYNGGKTKPLNEWMLRNYIDVAHEMKWISQSAKEVGEVLRDYRNYIHPYKELSRGVVIETKDALILWEISKSISRQIIGNL